MSDKRKRGWGTWIAAVVLLPALYVLSIGPAARLILARPAPPVAISLTVAFYTPLIVACDSTKPTREGLQWYVSLWADNVAILAR